MRYNYGKRIYTLYMHAQVCNMLYLCVKLVYLVFIVCSSQPGAEQPEVDEEGYSIRPQDADIL